MRLKDLHPFSVSALYKRWYITWPGQKDNDNFNKHY